MLTDKEWAKSTGVDPTVLGADVEPFTWFSLDLEDTLKEGVRYREDAVQDRAFPHLKGSNPLWSVSLPTVTQEELDRLDREDREAKRQTLLQKYIARGYAFETPTGEGDDDADCE